MNKKEYFENLLNLYNSVSLKEDVIPQENIADTGSDVNQGMQPEEEQMPEGEMYPEDPIMQQPEETAEDAIEKEKLKKIFELLDDLKNYGDIFSKTLHTIDINLVEDEKTLQKIFKYRNTLDELVEQIENYLINIFNKDTYNKILYSYITFRTEMVTIIKGLRDMLKLDKVDKEIFDNDK